MQHNLSVIFFDENEQSVNRTVVKIFCGFIVSGPAMILAKYLNIFPKTTYSALVIFTCLFIIGSIFLTLLLKQYPRSRFTKYACLSLLEFLVVVASLMPGISIFMSYLLVPILSSMYYNKRFTRIVSVVCYFIMLASLFMRSRMPVSVPVSSLHGIPWFLAYGIGATFEYVFCMTLVLHVTGIAHANLRKRYEQDTRIRDIQTKLIIGFANLVESKDHTTGEHIKRTSTYVRLICYQLRELGYYTEELSDTQINIMAKAAPLHDLGKIKISEDVLSKPGKLTKEEFELIKRHPIYGVDFIDKYLSGIETETYVKTAKEMALGHHEWWNGSGYPFCIAGGKIPLAARIMAAADVLDALLSERPYKEAYTIEKTFEIMKQLSGTQFDPRIIEAVLVLRDDIKRIITSD